MPAIASWLIARPRNAVTGLAATLLLPFGEILSGAALVLLVLQSGIRQVAIYSAFAVGIVTVAGYLMGLSVVAILLAAVAAWVPGAVLAALMRGSRSLTLTLQISVILAMLAVVALFVVYGDPAVFWDQWLQQMTAVLADSGMQELAAGLQSQHEQIVQQMTVFAVLMSWLLYVSVLMLGYALYQSLPDNGAHYGRFCDLNFGRVLALMVAGLVIAALATGVPWLQQIAAVSTAAFCLQGLAILHWLRAERRIPAVVVIAVYVLLPVLHVAMFAALTVAGYVDAWIGLRARAGTATAG